VDSTVDIQYSNTSAFASNSPVDNFSLWHAHFGHPSDIRMSILRTKCNCIPYGLVIVCDVCQKAKQKRLPFPSSSSSTNTIFQLLHVDIWDHVRFVRIMSLRVEHIISC